MVYIEFKFFNWISEYFYPNPPIEILLIVILVIVIFITYLKVYPGKNKFKNY